MYPAGSQCHFMIGVGHQRMREGFNSRRGPPPVSSMGVEGKVTPTRAAPLIPGKLILVNQTRKRGRQRFPGQAGGFSTTPVFSRMYENSTRLITLSGSEQSQKSTRILDIYFLLLFLWFAAIFSFAVNGAGFVLMAPVTAPGADFASALSGFFPLPF